MVEEFVRGGAAAVGRVLAGWLKERETTRECSLLADRTPALTSAAAPRSPARRRLLPHRPHPRPARTATGSRGSTWRTPAALPDSLHLRLLHLPPLPPPPDSRGPSRHRHPPRMRPLRLPSGDQGARDREAREEALGGVVGHRSEARQEGEEEGERARGPCSAADGEGGSRRGVKRSSSGSDGTSPAPGRGDCGMRASRPAWPEGAGH
jgi:hypothetical protein